MVSFDVLLLLAECDEIVVERREKKIPWAAGVVWLDLHSCGGVSFSREER